MAFTRITSTNIADGAVEPTKVSAAFEADYAKVANLASYAAIAEIASSSPPKINVVSYANSTYSILDDTAANTEGGYLVITGTGFQSGAQVVIGTTPATSTTYVSSTELRAQVPAANAASYQLSVVNPDGGTGIKINGITYSGTPTWVTGSTLNTQIVDTAFNITFDATDAVSYANSSALPTGTSLLSNGYFYGTVTGIAEDTTYSFTIVAIDAENQDSPRTFSLPVTVTTDIVAEVLLVAGGGSGGSGRSGDGGGGGGGAGGLLYYGAETSKVQNGSNVTFALGTTYNITIGAGGTGSLSAPGAAGYNGSNTTLIGGALSYTGIGGGHGGATPSSGVAKPGSSGGSGGGGPSVGNAGTPGQGNAGGRGDSGPNYARGGGGGAGAVGADSTGSVSGNGGAGLTYSISSSPSSYAGGGAAAGRAGYGNGGLGGGGGSGSLPGVAGTGGGGGAGAEGTVAGNGGSGIVIIKYQDSLKSADSTTGSPTFTQSGGYKIYKFTGSGSITW